MSDHSNTLLQNIHNSQFNQGVTITGPFGQRLLTYADYIASGQPLRMIENFIEKQVLPYYANTHTETSFTGLQTTNLREEARSIIKAAVNATEADAVIFTGTGSTGAVDKINRLLNQRSTETGEKFIIFHGPYEHHSNLLPWRESNFEVVPIAIKNNGLVDLDDLKQQLIHFQGKGTLIGSFSAASNVTGTLSPVDTITSLLHQYGALSFWDYAAAAPYLKIDMNPGGNLNKDAIFISTHKFIGGPGTPGILIAKKDLFSIDKPLVPSGGTVHFVTRNKQRYYEDVETREEGGTPGIIETIRAGLCFKLKQDIGEEVIHKLESEAANYAINEFKKFKNIYILGNTESQRLAFFSFHIRSFGKFLHHNFVVALLNDLFGIQSRGGCSCAGPYGHDLLDLSNDDSDLFMDELDTGNVGIKPGWSRINLNYFIPKYELKFIVKAVQWISENGYLLLKNYHFNDKTGQWKNTKNYHAALNSLHTFNTDIKSQKTHHLQTTEEKENELDSYFLIANKIAEEARQKWENTENQNYYYNQIENPLRWYTLAEDVQLNETTFA